MVIKVKYIWSAMILISVLCSAYTGTLDKLPAAIASGAANAMTCVLSFAGIMCFWCGIMRIMEKGGAINIIKKITSPVISLIFDAPTDSAREQIALNMSANLLGMGNAATPAGIRAMSELDKVNPHPDTPSRDMCMLTVINTTAPTLIPVSLMAYRAAAGGDPTSVILPVWVSAFTALIVAIISVKLFIRRDM